MSGLFFFIGGSHRDEDDKEDLPSESKRVQYRVSEILHDFERLHSEAWDIAARKDWTNCKALADVVVDEVVLVKQVPVTYLLYLEKQLNDVHTFVGRLPVLDENEQWKKDDQANLYKSELTKTNRTRKTPKSIVTVQPTEHHPAQVHLYNEDAVVGHWNLVKQSGAIPRTEKLLYIERIEKLINAVKTAREAANAIEEVTGVPKVGDSLFGYIFKPKA